MLTGCHDTMAQLEDRCLGLLPEDVCKPHSWVCASSGSTSGLALSVDCAPLCHCFCLGNPITLWSDTIWKGLAFPEAHALLLLTGTWTHTAVQDLAVVVLIFLSVSSCEGTWNTKVISWNQPHSCKHRLWGQQALSSGPALPLSPFQLKFLRPLQLCVLTNVKWRKDNI